jgi:hypothetical protein
MKHMKGVKQKVIYCQLRIKSSHLKKVKVIIKIREHGKCRYDDFR